MGSKNRKSRAVKRIKTTEENNNIINMSKPKVPILIKRSKAILYGFLSIVAATVITLIITNMYTIKQQNKDEHNLASKISLELIVQAGAILVGDHELVQSGDHELSIIYKNLPAIQIWPSALQSGIPAKYSSDLQLAIGNAYNEILKYNKLIETCPAQRLDTSNATKPGNKSKFTNQDKFKEYRYRMKYQGKVAIYAISWALLCLEQSYRGSVGNALYKTEDATAIVGESNSVVLFNKVYVTKNRNYKKWITLTVPLISTSRNAKDLIVKGPWPKATDDWSIFNTRKATEVTWAGPQ